MGQNYKYVPIDRVFSKLVRDLGGTNIHEQDVIEWTGEALEFIGAVPYYEEHIVFLEVKNHQCDLPAGIHAVIQIARNTRWCGPEVDPFCPATAIEACKATTITNDEPEVSIPVALDCQGMPINAYDIAYYRPFFDLKAEYFNWRNSSMYRASWMPVTLATHTLFNSIVVELDDPLYQSATDEYTIIKGKTVRFSFRDGFVAIACLKQVVDEETGYPLIPDNISYTTAIVKYVTMKLMERRFYSNREGSASQLQKAEQDWQWYCKQAGNVDMMPYGIDQHQNLLNQRSYLLPRQNRYYGFFGRLAQPESRPWNDPDGRNNKIGYFIGN